MNMPEPKFELNESGTVVIHSSVILFRQVINNVNVGPWIELTDDIRQHTLDGLKGWMARQTVSVLIKGNQGETWNPDELHSVNFDTHIWDYGLILQFYVPDNQSKKKLSRGNKQMIPYKVRCVDTDGVDDITIGHEYLVFGYDDDLIIVFNDQGQKKSYFPRRFQNTVEVA